MLLTLPELPDVLVGTRPSGPYAGMGQSDTGLLFSLSLSFGEARSLCHITGRR